jgi:hypothetical protein
MNDNKREQAEELIYKVLDTVGKTHANSDYYRKLFSSMTDTQFFAFFKRRLPIRFHMDEFKISPKMYEVVEAFKILNKPLFEKVNLPYIYTDSQGNPIQSQEALVLILHIKRMKQMLSKKNNASMHTAKRDMRTGLLSQEDKASKETDREFESLASYGLDETIEEFRSVKADALKASNEMIATIVDKGSVSQKDYVLTRQDGIARNLLNTYLIGAGIHSSLVNTDYMTPYTARRKTKFTERV